MKIAVYIFIFSALLTYQAKAQVDKTIDSIVQKMYWYSLQKPSTTLFVHFDKNVYTNSEAVWLAAYLLKSNPNDLHHTLSVAVIRNDDRSISTEAKFVMDQQLGYGSFYLPDSMPTGNYTFVCYTNQLLNGNPMALFTQPVTIKTAKLSGFTANLSLIDSINAGVDSVRVLLKAYTSDNVALVRGASVNYFIGDRLHPLKKGSIKTDNFGEAKISIPLKQITAADNVLQTEITNGTETKTFSIRLPIYKKDVSVKFYPEGGNLVSGTKNVVGWEVLNNEGDPLMSSAGLYEDERLLQHIETGAYGIGKFSIIPQQGKRYYVKLQKHEYATDSAYSLPKLLDGAPLVSVENALAADTLLIRMNTNSASKKWVVTIHDYHTTFVASLIALTQSSIVLKIPLADVPKGLNTFTLLDTLGRPWAERMFFAHYDNQPVVSISTDTASYRRRQKVELKLKITDPQQKPLSGFVSVACAQDNRFDVKKMTDIESYAYLRSQLSLFPFKKELMNHDQDSKEFLENVLLVKGWRRYTWQDITFLKAIDTLQEKTSLDFKGTTLLNNKPLKRPVQLNLRKYLDVKVSTLEFLKTDSVGHFELLPDNLLSEPNRKVELTVNGRQQEFYTIRINDSYKLLHKKLAETLTVGNYNLNSFAQSSQNVVLKKEEGGKRLLDVTVTAKQDNTIYGSRGVNVCGDYVCMYGILNCRNHPMSGYEPVVGRTYQGRVYLGCAGINNKEKDEHLLSMDGIYKSKEFYVIDLSKTDASDPQYLSTIYWNYAMEMDANGEAKATFFTGDIEGKFRVVVQGITSKNVVYGEHFFIVQN